MTNLAAESTVPSGLNFSSQIHASPTPTLPGLLARELAGLGKENIPHMQITLNRSIVPDKEATDMNPVRRWLI